MLARSFALVVVISGTLATPVAEAFAQGTPAPGRTPPPPAAARPAAPAPPARAVRRDIPLTNMIRRAFAGGTRDSTGRPGRSYWQLWMDYTIAARLDPATSMLTGRETIILNNNSDSALTAIVMRLDQNIFRPNVPRAAPSVPSETHDGMRITRLAINGQEVNLAAAPGRGGGGGGAGRGGGAGAPAVPTIGGISTTSARITLPAPIPPKKSASIEVDWGYKLAGGDGGSGHRMTYRWADTLYQVAQWYPRVAVYDDLRGWDTDPYLGPSEFYNSFGHFDVKIDLPAGWIMGATGVLQNPAEVLTPIARERLTHVLEKDTTLTIVSADEAGPGRATAVGDRLIWHYVADTVNDFAWATAKNFVWDATRATIPGKGPIPVNILYLPGHTAAYAQAGPTTRHALEFYSKLWIPDAFPVHTVVDGPDAGMEYPMFIMASTGAADHESGHQWWPMMVSGNETWYGWMDEGFNQYMNILSAIDRGQNQTLDNRGQSYGRTSGDEHEGPLMWDANYGGPSYSFQAYSKTPLMLSMLGGIVGDSAVWRAMSQYAQAWRFKHPSPWDYAFFMNNALHQDLSWFWYYWLFTTESVDGRIQSVTPGTAGRTTVTVRQDGQMPSPVVLKVEFAPTGAAIRPMANAKMLDSTTAIVTWPADVWFAGSRTYQAALSFGPRAIRKVTLDPNGRFPDRDTSDNVWEAKR